MDLTPGALQRIEAPADLGDLRAWPGVELPGLARSADVYAWLPPGYDDGDQRYPVLYLHDGHNLFLPGRSFAGATWDTGQAMGRLAARGLPAVVIGIPCHDQLRGEEYSPYPHPEYGGGRADDYVTFAADHLKPAVDAALRTRPEPEHTVVAGSSLGAVVSAHLWVRRPDVVGGLGLFSPAFWWPGEPALLDLERALAEGRLPGRVYLDVGGREKPDDPDTEAAYVRDAERLLGALRAAGVPVRYLYDSAALHVEAAWAERFPAAARWLLDGYRKRPHGRDDDGGALG